MGRTNNPRIKITWMSVKIETREDNKMEYEIELGMEVGKYLWIKIIMVYPQINQRYPITKMKSLVQPH